MAATFTVVGSTRTVQVYSPTVSVDVERFFCYTKPSGVYFEAAEPYSGFLAADESTVLSNVAAVIEGSLSAGDASAAAFVQDIDANGLLADYIQFTVTLPQTAGSPFQFSTYVNVPVSSAQGIGPFTGDVPGTMLAQAKAALQAAAGI